MTISALLAFGFAAVILACTLLFRAASCHSAEQHVAAAAKLRQTTSDGAKDNLFGDEGAATFTANNFNADVWEDADGLPSKNDSLRSLAATATDNKQLTGRNLFPLRRWKKRYEGIAQIYYEIDNVFSAAHQKLIKDSLKSLETQTKVVKFLERTRKTQTPYIRVVDQKGGCESDIIGSAPPGKCKIIGLSDGTAITKIHLLMRNKTSSFSLLIFCSPKSAPGKR